MNADFVALKSLIQNTLRLRAKLSGGEYAICKNSDNPSDKLHLGDLMILGDIMYEIDSALKSLEFILDPVIGKKFCIVCESLQPENHLPDCEFVKLEIKKS